ncbi:MAG: phage terminase large subunit family protein [Bdellovibrionales bacterium]
MSAIDIARREFFKTLQPPKKMTLSEWADDKFYLSAESSAEAGRWHTLPYQKGIMDAITDPAIEQVSVQKSARVGYTKIMNAAIGYYIDQDPCSIMVVQPSIEDAQGYSKEEIAPMLRDTPALRNLVSDAKTKDGENNILQKNFPGGTLGIIGAHSGRGFRRVSRRVVIFDEVDGYPASAGDEGDQIKLGIKRTEYFWNRKILAGSTPLIKDHSRIERLFLSGDQRRYYVPCPHCGEMQYLKFKNLHWDQDKPETAYFACEINGCVIEHKDKRSMIEKGEWRGTAPFDGKHASFHIWAAYSYSPNASWAQLAKEFLEAKHDPELLKTFINTALGETWEEEYTAKLGASDLEARAEIYPLGTAPSGVLFLTAGVDVQDNRFAVTIDGWGVGEESWTVSHQEIFGDPSQSAIWNQLSNLLNQPVKIEGSDAFVKIRAACIDSGGHFTHEVYQFARENKSRLWVAVKGASQRGKPAIGKPSSVDINFKDKALKRGARVYVLGVDTIKSTIFARLKHNKPGPGYIHFSHELKREYYDQLTAEKQITRFVKGFPVKEWTKKPGARNEALDTKVYSYAALQLYISRHNRQTFWAQMEKLIEIKPENDQDKRNSGQSDKNKPTIQIRKNFVTGFLG